MIEYVVTITRVTGDVPPNDSVNETVYAGANQALAEQEYKWARHRTRVRKVSLLKFDNRTHTVTSLRRWTNTAGAIFESHMARDVTHMESPHHAAI